MKFFKKRCIAAVFAIAFLVTTTGCNLVNSGILFLEKAMSSSGEAILEIDCRDRFYYPRLSPEEQKDYRLLLSAYQRMDKKIVGLDASGSDIVKLNKMVLLDCPELFWVVNSGVYYSDTAAFLIDTGISYEPRYRYTREQVVELMNEIDKVCAPIIGEYANASDYEKALAAYEFIIEISDYDEEKAEAILLDDDYDPVSDTSQCMTSVFTEGKSVCAGYAFAYQYLLSKMGVFATSVIGTAAEDGDGQGYSHQWNLLSLDGGYYYTDITWGDSRLNSTEADYAYFCITEEELLFTHRPNEWVEYPTADEIENNYYYRNGFYCENLDTFFIGNLIEKAVSEKKSELTVKFAKRTDYADFYNYLETGQGKASFLNVILLSTAEAYEWLDIQKTAFSVSDSLCIVRIHFSYK